MVTMKRYTFGESSVGCLNPRLVTGSLPTTVPEAGEGEEEEEVGRVGSCTVRTLGKAVSEEEEESDWSRCLYSRTVPSAKPMAK